MDGKKFSASSITTFKNSLKDTLLFILRVSKIRSSIQPDLAYVVGLRQVSFSHNNNSFSELLLTI